MRLVSRLLAVAVVASGLVPLTAGASWACSCLPGPTTVEQLAREAPLAYVAEVVRRDETEPYYEYGLRVQRSVKGGVWGERTVRTGKQSSVCGVTLPVGARVLVTREPFSSCSGVLGGDVDALAAEMRAVLARPATVHVVQPGQTWHDIARTELRRQTGAEPPAAFVTGAARALQAANRRVVTPQPRAGARVLVPRLA